MKNIIFCIVILLNTFLLSCGNQKKIFFTHYEYENDIERKVRYSLIIPKGYRVVTSFTTGETGVERKYIYSDSALIYVSNMEEMSYLNYSNIKNKPEEIQKRYSAFINKDTLTLKGRDSMGLLWKDIKLKEISIGYINVNPNKEHLFDQALNSIRNKVR